MVVGFSELKELLIQTYTIDRDRVFVKLHFSEQNDELIMHDYDDHKKMITLIPSLKEKFIWRGLQGKAHQLIKNP